MKEITLKEWIEAFRYRKIRAPKKLMVFSTKTSADNFSEKFIRPVKK